MFRELLEDDIDERAYDNLIYALHKNNLSSKTMQNPYDLANHKKEVMARMVYEIFCGLADKGEGYRHSIIGLDRARLFDDDYNANFGNVDIVTNYDLLIAESHLEYNSYIKVIKGNDKTTIFGLLQLNDGVVTQVSGKEENGMISEVQIASKDYVYYIKGLKLPYLVGLLSSGVISGKFLRGKENTRDGRAAVVNELLNRYPFLDRYDLYDFINKNVTEYVDLHYYQNQLSSYVIKKSLENFLKELEMGYMPGVLVSKEEIKGLDFGKDAIDKFINYEITDIFGDKWKLTDIPLSLKDSGNLVECQFLDYLSQVPDEDLDVFAVGLCYFANYCEDMGGNDSSNRMGVLFANRLRGKKLNTAIKSRVLGVPLADYANYRGYCYYYKNRNYPKDSDFMIPVFYRILGFNIGSQDLEKTMDYKDVDVWVFRNILPNMSPRRERKSYWHY